MLIAPFQWYHPCIVSVPTNLIDILEAPVPIMVGLSQELYNTIQDGLEDIESSCAWVFADSNKIEFYLSEYEQQFMYKPNFDSLQKRLMRVYNWKGEFKNLNSKIAANINNLGMNNLRSSID